MRSELLNSLEFDIDLAFNGFAGEEFSSCKSVFLNDSEYWRTEIMIWMNYIRQNSNLILPELIREITSFSIGLQFTDDSSIRKLNSQWLNKFAKTDVLSFPIFDESMVFLENHCIELGDIVVSIPMAYHQAKEQNHSFETELRWLVSHGFLHLLGWDHQDHQKLKDMLYMQEQLLKMSGNL